MVETLTVSPSGPAFSLLLYENVRKKLSQEGFLFGEIIEKKTNSITDNDERVTKIDRVIKVNSMLPCPNLSYFYDATGKIDSEIITKFLGDQKPKVVAWYKFKHVNAFKMTLREKIVHKQLCSYFAPAHPELFLCCLLTMNSSQIDLAHLYSQTFLRYIEPSYQMLPMHIENLSDPNNSYKSITPIADAFSRLVGNLPIDKEKTSGVNIIMQIKDELQERTEEVAEKLSDAEKRYHELQEEVKVLRDMYEKKMRNNSRVRIGAVVENGSGDLNSDDVNSSKGGTVSKRTSAPTPRGNSSRSPVKQDISEENIINSRTRNRTPVAAQKK